MTRDEITAQFSGGEWVVETNLDGVVCGVRAPESAQSACDFVCTLERGANPHDARLIAAAPDLLACFLDVYKSVQASELPLALRFKFAQTMAKIEPALPPEMTGG